MFCSRLIEPLGGGLTFTSFSDLLERTLSSREAFRANPRPAVGNGSKYLPLAIILDSTPGTGSNMGSVLVAGMNKGVKKTAVFVSATILMSVYFGTFSLLRVPQPFATMNARLLRGDIIPQLSDYFTPRLYIFSAGDELVDCREIEAHLGRMGDVVVESRKETSPHLRDSEDVIIVERFGPESAHIKHVRTDPLRYWNAVDHLWKRALRERQDVVVHCSCNVKAKL